jgi:hypothetical protein
MYDLFEEEDLAVPNYQVIDEVPAGSIEIKIARRFLKNRYRIQ